MRVLQLGPYPPPHGGVQSNLVAIRTFLRRHDVPCAVINITRHRKPDSDEVYYPKSAAGLIQLLLRLDYDVLHLHVGGMLSRRLLSLGLVCTLMRRSKSVMTFHSGGYPSSAEGKSTTRNSLAGFVLRRFDGLIGVNPEIISFFQRLGVAPSRTRLIYPHSFLAEENSRDGAARTSRILFQRAQPGSNFSRPAGTGIRSSSADRSPGTSPPKVSVSWIVVNWIGKPRAGPPRQESAHPLMPSTFCFVAMSRTPSP